jgi:glycosyltransferase involved in cell wall biosynthesis
VAKRILHILGAPRAEGTPRLVLDWLTVADYTQGVLCLAAAPAELEPDLRKQAAWWHKVDLIKPGVAKYRTIPDAVRAACIQFQPDLVVSWPTWVAGLVGLGIRRAGRARIVQHCGNPARQEWCQRLLADVRFLPFYLAGGTFACCSDYVRDSFRQRTPFFKRRYQTSYNCVQAAAISERACRSRAIRTGTRGPVLLMVATMEDHKDYATLLRAFARFSLTEPGPCLRLAGDGSLRASLEVLAGKLGIADRVEFLGARRDVPELLGDADLFVFSTTRQEGLGIVLLEAMAAGVPVIASDVPACRELLAGGGRGRLVAPGDPAALAQALGDSLAERSNPALEAIIARAMQHAASLTPQRMISEYLDLAIPARSA